MIRGSCHFGLWFALLLRCAGAAGPGVVPEAKGVMEAVIPASRAGTQADDDAAFGLPVVAGKMVDRGDLESAERSFREVLESGKFSREDQKQALLGLARLHRKKNAFAKAAAIYERFLEDFPADHRGPSVLLELGRTLRSMGTYAAALSRFYLVINSSLKLGSDEISDYQTLARTAQFEIAETHFAMGNYAEAARFFARFHLLDLEPGDRALALFRSGCAHQLAEDHEAAVRTLREFIESYPQDDNVAEAHFLLATSYWKMNRREAALSATLQLFRNEAARLGRHATRWAYWQRRTGNQLANDLYQVGETQSALQVYLRLAELTPEPEWRLPALYQAALCYERLKASPSAFEIYRSIGEAAAKHAANAALADLARMAAWRLEQLSWQDETTQKISGLFSTLPPPTANPPAAKIAEPVKAAGPKATDARTIHDSSPSPKPTSGGL
jgi:tetratricopeptide (TPR) repeat protein